MTDADDNVIEIEAKPSRKPGDLWGNLIDYLRGSPQPHRRDAAWVLMDVLQEFVDDDDPGLPSQLPSWLHARVKRGNVP